MFYDVKDWSKALSTQPTNIIFCGSWYLIIVVATSLSFLNVTLNGLKHETSKGWNACEVCEGEVIMSKPKAIACFRAFNVTCDPWPFRTNKWRLVWEISLGIECFKNEKNSLKRKFIIHAFGCIAIHVPGLHC